MHVFFPDFQNELLNLYFCTGWAFCVHFLHDFHAHFSLCGPRDRRCKSVADFKRHFAPMPKRRWTQIDGGPDRKVARIEKIPLSWICLLQVNVLDSNSSLSCLVCLHANLNIWWDYMQKMLLTKNFVFSEPEVSRCSLTFLFININPMLWFIVKREQFFSWIVFW